MDRLQDLYKLTGERENIISMIGNIPLEGLPHAISMMDFTLLPIPATFISPTLSAYRLF